eukprot:TRINITY_DN562_c0_g1_i8.p1 TRINITY_DN562_c0_g1~~TRINITY_DN562_c0_g1_i8.p1  ORF type:complete len:303 (+),score=39.09 TRINITY_DN562_c0_g1_i8:122-1030(+)
MRSTCIGMKSPREIISAPYYNPGINRKGDRLSSAKHRSRPPVQNKFVDRFAYTKQGDRTPINVGPGRYNIAPTAKPPAPREAKRELADGEAYEMVGERRVFNKSFCRPSTQKLLEKFAVNIDLTGVIPIASERKSDMRRLRSVTRISQDDYAWPRSSHARSVERSGRGHHLETEPAPVSDPERIRILQSLLAKTDEEIRSIVNNASSKLSENYGSGTKKRQLTTHSVKSLLKPEDLAGEKRAKSNSRASAQSSQGVRLRQYSSNKSNENHKNSPLSEARNRINNERATSQLQVTTSLFSPAV